MSTLNDEQALAQAVLCGLSFFHVASTVYAAHGNDIVAGFWLTAPSYMSNIWLQNDGQPYGAPMLKRALRGYARLHGLQRNMGTHDAMPW